jgi:hypothetical protein
VAHRSTTTGSGATTTGGTVAIPGDVVSGDILICAVTNRDATADPTVTDNDVGGNSWALLDHHDDGTRGASVWWKRATGSTASKTITIAGCTGSCAFLTAAFSGRDTGATPYEAVASSVATGTTTKSLPGITTSVADVDVVVCYFNVVNDLGNTGLVINATDPASMTVVEHLSTGGSDCGCHFAPGTRATAGATGAFTWTQGSNVVFGITFGLLPAAAAGGGDGPIFDGRALGLGRILGGSALC